MLQQLEQNAETHELWGELQTEADYAVNKQTKDILTRGCTLLHTFVLNKVGMYEQTIHANKQ
jgi:hypothetical protein